MYLSCIKAYDQKFNDKDLNYYSYSLKQIFKALHTFIDCCIEFFSCVMCV